MRRVIRAVASAAHAEGGCAIRELCGVRRLLDAAATHLSPAEGALDLDPIGDVEGESEKTDSFANRPRLRRRRSGRPGDRCAARRPRISSRSWTSWSPPCPRWRTAGNRRAGARTRRRGARGFPLGALPAKPRGRRLAASLAAAPNADRASAFTRVLPSGGRRGLPRAHARRGAERTGTGIERWHPREGETKSPFAILLRRGAGPSRRASGCSGGWSRGRGRGGRRHVGSRRTSRRSLPLRRAPRRCSRRTSHAPMRVALDFGAKTLSGASCRRLEHRRGRLRAGDFVERVTGRFLGSAAARGVLGAALASIHLAPLAAPRRCVPITLACADAENRSVINQSPEWRVGSSRSSPPRRTTTRWSVRAATCSTCRRGTR